MSEKRLFVLAHPEARRRAMACVAEAPDGYRVSVEPPRRDLAINAALHAALCEIAELRRLMLERLAVLEELVARLAEAPRA